MLQKYFVLLLSCQWNHVLEDYKISFPSLFYLTYLVKEKTTDSMVCRTLVTAQSNSFSRPVLPPCNNGTNPGGSFKLSLRPRPPAEKKQTDRGTLGISAPGQTMADRREGGGVQVVARNRRRAGGGAGLQTLRRGGKREVKCYNDPYFEGGVEPWRFYCQCSVVAFCPFWGEPLGCYCIMGRGM